MHKKEGKKTINQKEKEKRVGKFFDSFIKTVIRSFFSPLLGVSHLEKEG